MSEPSGRGKEHERVLPSLPAAVGDICAFDPILSFNYLWSSIQRCQPVGPVLCAGDTVEEGRSRHHVAELLVEGL